MVLHRLNQYAFDGRCWGYSERRICFGQIGECSLKADLSHKSNHSRRVGLPFGPLRMVQGLRGESLGGPARPILKRHDGWFPLPLHHDLVLELFFLGWLPSTAFKPEQQHRHGWLRRLFGRGI
jgi:hypothetical protein